MDLTGKTAVITGSAGGIGLGIARACFAEGMNVMLSDLDGERCAATANALAAAGGSPGAQGGAIAHRPCDVRSRSSVDELRDAAFSAFGQVDLVSNNAGIGLTRPFLDTTEADWSLLMDVNVHGVVNGLHSFLPLFVEQGGGHVTATASLSGIVADPDLSTYNATKFAVVGMMQSLAHELARDHPGVGASVLCPGPVATDLMASSEANLVAAGAASTASDERSQDVAAYLAAGTHPDEVGRIAVDGIKTGRFWLLSHPELTIALANGVVTDMATGALFASDEDWTDQS